MVKKVFTNRVVLNTIVLGVFTFIVEMLVRFFTEASFGDIAVFRIFISSIMVSLIVSFIGHFLPKLGARILNIIYILFISIYEFVEFGLFNYLGFFMGVGNSEQGTKVMGYIRDFMNALKPEYYIILLVGLIFIIYYVVIDRIIMKNKKRNEELSLLQKGYIEVITVVAILLLCGGYYLTIRSESMQNELQTESNYSLWLYPENSNLTVNNFGVLMYGFSDIRSIILGIDSDYVAKLEAKNYKENKKPGDDIIVPVDYKRVIDDTAWKKLNENTDDETFNTLNDYYMNRTITPKNDYTGLFEGKNLILILMESVNEIAILNEEYFPTLYKMYHEGMSFTNNYSPRNNCSTGNNELTVLSSMFTINNTCTANRYSSNKYYQGAFFKFREKGYKATSYHDYTEKYYQRTKMHTNLGSEKFYSVTDIGMTYDPKYEEWPSDVDMFKHAKEYYMNEDKFFAYFATVSTHQTYNVPSELGDKYREKYEKLGYSKTLSRYLSKMQILDEAMEELLNELMSEGKLENTVIAMFGDHYPYGLTDDYINEFMEKNDAGYKVNHILRKKNDIDRTPMLIYNAGMEPVVVKDYTSILDLLPTLMNLFNLDYDPRLYMGTDIFSELHESRVVFADGSWQNEIGYYYAPGSKMNYFGDETLSSEELKSINKDISIRQKMSASAIQSNYFNYLGEGLKKYESVKTTSSTSSTIASEPITIKP